MRHVVTHLTLGLAATLVFAALPTRADAQRYDTQYCVRTYDGAMECAYFTLKQCLAAASATGGDCAVNPRYVGQPEPRSRAVRPYR